jgi:hypothetical protein
VVAGVAILTGLAVAGCASGPASPVGTAGASSPATPGGGSSSRHDGSGGPLAPLTGLPVASSADAARPAVALDISGGKPHGLTSADVVLEEFASPVRYIAIYQSRQASNVGPIAPTQPTDRAALAVLHPLVGYDGAASNYFIKLLDKTKITDVSFSRAAALYAATGTGLTTSTRAILRRAGGDAAPQPLFYYRGVGAAGDSLASSGESRRSSVSVTVPGFHVQNWAFDQRADQWKLTSGGPAVTAANIVVQTVHYKRLNISPRHGIVVPSAEITGTGRAEVFSGGGRGSSGGTVAAGTWSKPRINDLTNYFDSSGAPMAFQPGPTWIILAPPGTRVRATGAQA